MEGHHFLFDFYGTRSFPRSGAINKKEERKIESIKESCSSPFSRVSQPPILLDRVGKPYGAFSLVSIRPYDLLQVR